MNAEDIAWMDEMARSEDGERRKRDMERVERIESSAVDVVKKSEVDSQRFVIEKTNGKGEVISTSFDVLGFSRWLVEESGEHFVTVRGDEDVYMYEDGVYIKYGDAYIRSILFHVMNGEYITNHVEKEVIGRVRSMTYSDWNVFDGSEDIINMENGLYRFSTGEFMPHTPDYKTLTKSEVRYDKDAECPEIDKFFKGMAEPERLMTLYEIMGYALMPRKLYKRGFILYGRPDTGKSKYTDLLSTFVGLDATATVNPSVLAKYAHAGAELYGKLVNVLDDLGDTPITDTGIIKSMIGDGVIRMNPKGKEGRSFRAHVTNVWCCNDLPKISDKHFGDKFDLLHINNKYGGHSKPDQHLLKKITEPTEMSGLFNKAIAAFKGVEKRGEFTGSKSAAERTMDWEHTSRPISRFVDERCELIDWSPDDEGGIVLAEGFYKAYTQFANEIKAKVESRQLVRTYLEETYSVFSTKKRLNAENPRACYIGIAIKSVPGNKPREKSLEQQKPLSGDGGVPTVPTIYSMLGSSNKINNQVESSMETKPGTTGTNRGTDGDNGKGKAGTETGTYPTSLPPSKSDDFDANTANIIRTTIKELVLKSNGSDGCGIDDIVRACPRSQPSVIHKHLTVYFNKLNIEKVNDNYYKLRD